MSRKPHLLALSNVCRAAGRALTRPLCRWLLSLSLLASVVLWVDVQALAARLGALSPEWVALALVVTVPQVVLSAWRWRLTARHMGLSLPFRRAIGEYYLATFLNQILPGGVSGDVGRAWRHGSDTASRGAALRAVVIERASGQFALALVALSTLLVFTPLREGLSEVLRGVAPGPPVGIPGLAALGAVAFAVPALLIVSGREPRWLATLRFDVRRSLWVGGLWRRQLTGSLLIVITYMLVFVCCARALGEDLSLATLLALSPPVLMAMAIPLSVAGWGIRESAAALVWILAGLPAQQGVAISVTYGAVVLVSSLPGAARLFFLRRRRTA